MRTLLLVACCCLTACSSLPIAPGAEARIEQLKRDLEPLKEQLKPVYADMMAAKAAGVPTVQRYAELAVAAGWVFGADLALKSADALVEAKK